MEIVPRKSFKKLAPALEYAKCHKFSSVFSYEVGRNGYRQFLVCDVDQFWSFYRNMEIKHYYEIIVFPKQSKLYFDLEYPVAENETKDGIEMTKSFVKCVNKILVNEYHQSVSSDEILILESTSENKFSVHIIYKRITFETNCDIRTFIRKLVNSFNDQEKVKFECYSSGKKRLFLDELVYDKNRNFRLFLSSKFGRKNQFIYSVMNENESKDLSQVFKESLITNIPEDAVLLETFNINKAEESRMVHEGSKPTICCPFPEIEKLINRNIACPGFIDGCQFYPKTSIYRFDVSGTRYCPNVERVHRRNRIYFVFNASTLLLEQKCHSTHCLGFSKIIVIPPELDFKWFTNMKEWNEI